MTQIPQPQHIITAVNFTGFSIGPNLTGGASYDIKDWHSYAPIAPRRKRRTPKRKPLQRQPKRLRFVARLTVKQQDIIKAQACVLPEPTALPNRQHTIGRLAELAKHPSFSEGLRQAAEGFRQMAISTRNAIENLAAQIGMPTPLLWESPPCTNYSAAR